MMKELITNQVLGTKRRKRKVERSENTPDIPASFSEYAHWLNSIRIYGSLGYLTPVEFKEMPLWFLSEMG